MTLADDIQSLESRALEALHASYDYFADSRLAWRILQTLIEDKGLKFHSRNHATGTHIDEQRFLELAQSYVTRYLTAFTFQHFVSLFEDFLFDLLRTWLAAFPQSLSSEPLELRTVLEASGTEAVVGAVVDRKLHALAHQRPGDWFKFLKRLSGIDGPAEHDIARLAEIKASRDVLVHNNGIANAVYVRKAGPLARRNDGEKLSISSTYHRESWAVIERLIRDLSAAAIVKARGGSAAQR